MNRIRRTIKSARASLQMWWLGLSDQWKATLKTAWQSIVGAFVLGTLLLLGSFTTLLSGREVDLVQDASNAARVFGLAVLGAVTGVFTFWQNRNNAPKY